jgi:hypothetical protein
VNAVLLRLPFGDPERLVRFEAFDPAHQIPLEVSYIEIGEWRRANRTFDDIAGIGSTAWSYVLEGADGDVPQSIQSMVVSGNFFDVVGSRALLGRTLRPQDDTSVADRVAVLSHDLWRSRFGADPSAIGRAIRLSGSMFTIVGVMPPMYQYPPGTDLWTPIAPELAELGRRQKQDLLGARFFGVLHGIGRLKSGTSAADGQGDLSGLIRRDAQPNLRVRLTPLVDNYLGRVRWALVIALGSVFLLFAIACSNVAGLLLARTARRRQEWAIRGAIGGTHKSIVRLVAVDAVLVALTATLSGAAAAPLLVRAIGALDPSGLLANFPIPIDNRVVVATVAAGLIALLAGAVAPCAHALRMMATDSVVAASTPALDPAGAAMVDRRAGSGHCSASRSRSADGAYGHQRQPDRFRLRPRASALRPRRGTGRREPRTARRDLRQPHRRASPSARRRVGRRRVSRAAAGTDRTRLACADRRGSAFPGLAEPTSARQRGRSHARLLLDHADPIAGRTGIHGRR